MQATINRTRELLSRGCLFQPILRGRRTLYWPIAICFVSVFSQLLAAQWTHGQNLPPLDRPTQPGPMPRVNPNAVPDAPPVEEKKSSSKEVKIEIPAPANLTLDTKDGVTLHCTFFGAPQDPEKASGKETMPFILLHDWEGDRTDLLPFALYLQKLGCAVIVPDLRGHGESIKVAGLNRDLDYKKFRKTELAAVINDIEECKKYLVHRNNEGELNVDMLNVVAVGETSVLAMQWVINDWFLYPDVTAVKQSKDVKTLTMVAPRKRLSGVNITPLVKHQLFSGRTGKNLPTLILWSSGDEVAGAECASIYEQMRKGRPDPEELDDAAEREQQETLFSAAIPRTSASGTELIRQPPVAGVWEYIAKFVASQVLTRKEDMPWQNRER